MSSKESPVTPGPSQIFSDPPPHLSPFDANGGTGTKSIYTKLIEQFDNL